MAFVVFDLDHTLYDGDSGTRLFKWLILRSRWRSLLALLIAPIAGPMIAWLPTRRRGISLFVFVGTIGMSSRGNLDHAIDQYVATHRPALRQELLKPAMKQLQTHIDQGDTVLIATGAPTRLARDIVALITDVQLPIIGTVETPKWGGLVARQHCHSENKVRMIRAAGFTQPIDYAYSDSRADMPLLMAAKNPVVVNPNASSVKDFERILPPGTPILWWGAKGRAGLR